MNLKILPTNVMLTQSRRWLAEPDVRALIEPHALGAAMLVEIQRAHDRLSLQSEHRRKLAIALARLTRLISGCDLVHDSKGRALYTGLTSLAEGADAPELARLYLDLRDLLFPEGLVIVSRSYAYEAGAIEALERRITPEVIAQLESIQMARKPWPSGIAPGWRPVTSSDGWSGSARPCSHARPAAAAGRWTWTCEPHAVNGSARCRRS